MRVVLDSNVLVSGAMTPHGTCRQIVDLLAQFRIELCVDDRILEEYRDVLHRPELKIEPAEVAVVSELIDEAAIHVACSPMVADLPDPADLPFLEVAYEGNAILVTGNKRHFPKPACKRVHVLSPREFLDVLSSVG